MRGAILATALALTTAPAFAAPVHSPPTSEQPSSSHWVQAFPSPERALAGVQGDDRLDTLGKQFDTLEYLWWGLYHMSGGGQAMDITKMSPAVAAKRRAYEAAIGKINDAVFPTSQGDDRKNFAAAKARYSNLEFETALVHRLLPPAIGAQLQAKVAKFRGPSSRPPMGTPPQPPSHEFELGLLSTFIFPLLGLGAFLLLLIGMFRGRGRARVLTQNHGSARYAEVRRDVEPERLLHGVFLGKSSHPDLKEHAPLTLATAPIFTQTETHTLILARSGTGKGTRVIVPTLLRYADSMIVIDPKGENAAITARIRAKVLGQAVHIVNPWGELEGEYRTRGFPVAATFNPLDVLKRDDRNAVAIAQSLAQAICGAAADKDSFWRGQASALLSAVFLWLTDQPGEKKTLERARQIVTMSKAEFEKEYLARMKASKAFRGAISELASPFIGMAEETYSGIISNLAEATKFISDPLIKESTASSSFAMTDLIEGRATIYLVFPTDRMNQARTWLRLILAAVTHTFRRTPRRHDSPRCMFVIDEFPALGRLDEMPGDIAVMRGFGLDFTLVVQGIDQLRDHYGEAHRTIINNCAYKWFCNISDPETAKYLSEACGKKTVGTTSTGSSSGPGGTSTSQTESEMGRDLITPDEVIALGKDVAIVLNPEGGRPFYLHPIDYWNLTPAFAHLAQGSMRSYFTPAITFDDNPYVRKSGQQKPGGEKAAGEKPGGQKAGQGDQQQKAPPPKTHDGMTRAKALDILGLKDAATPQEIKAAYIKRVKDLHSDRAGGSAELMKLVNSAKDFLDGKK